MIFSRNTLQQNPRLTINNVNIQRVEEAKFLGVILNEKLSWSPHLKALKSKMARYVGIMYKIKASIPLKVRLQIFHSFIQSHLNYCSLVWGFTNKSNIDSLFIQQKKGIRAIMPGHVQYSYKNGVLPTGTKTSFNSLKILTVHGIIASNAIMFMNKVHNFPSQLPRPVSDTIHEDAPSGSYNIDTNPDSHQSWLDHYNTNIYRNSVFFKGPLLIIDPSVSNIYDHVSCQSISAFKAQCKRTILALQRSGEENEWSSNNFLIQNISGLRKSKRKVAVETPI